MNGLSVASLSESDFMPYGRQKSVVRLFFKTGRCYVGMLWSVTFERDACLLRLSPRAELDPGPPPSLDQLIAGLATQEDGIFRESVVEGGQAFMLRSPERIVLEPGCPDILAIRFATGHGIVSSRAHHLKAIEDMLR
jgi:hypothetical protein